MEPKIHTHHHHILPIPVALAVGAALLVLTGVTVWIAGVDLGSLNFVIAMAVATCKALLVALFFMNLKYDKPENGMIFATSFLFLAIFFVLTATDVLFRGDVAVKGPLLMATESKIKVKKPWIVTPALIAHGKEIFAIQCATCHGPNGEGNGPAAAALNPHPRNFHAAEGWVNGRKPSQVFKTLKEGIPGSGMASFATLPPDDRWALAHFVLTFGSPPPSDSAGDLAAIGINPNSETAEAVKETPSIPVEFALERMTVPDPKIVEQQPLSQWGSKRLAVETIPSRPGAQLYQQRCVECHGIEGKGGVHVQNLGAAPVAAVVTTPFKKGAGPLASQESFNRLMLFGIQGEPLHRMGELTTSELKDLYQHVNELSR